MLTVDEGGRIGLETKIMLEFLLHQRERVEEYSKLQEEGYQQKVKNLYEKAERLLAGDSKQLSDQKENIQTILESYNRNHRLKSRNDVNSFVPQLVEMEKKYKLGSLPPPMPSEYLLEDVWLSDEKEWIGHGYYWKSGDGPMHKDLSFSDFDSLEDKFRPLTNANVLVADYGLLKKDFECLQTLSNEQIDEWLIRQSAFISEGQINRCRDGGDQFDLVGDISSCYDTESSKIGVRMKGGGRAATFLINDEYGWTEDGLFTADMIEVKGVGTSILQQEIEVKACGFLSYVDALKEFAFEKLIHRVSEIENQEWGTVQYYAIIDSGIKYKDECANPATGYKGDRCVLVLRQRQSRIISCFDEIVYYSVVRRSLLETGRGKSFCEILAKYGISSEQIPAQLFAPDEAFRLDGDWNVQSDAPLTHIVDFSHFFVLPSSPIHEKWKMRSEDVQEALLLGAEHFGVFTNHHLQKLLGCDDEKSVRKLYEEKIGKLEEKYKAFGSIGKRKPDYSWSWFLEVDNSWIMSYAMKTGTNNETNSCDLMQFLSECLPK